MRFQPRFVVSAFQSHSGARPARYRMPHLHVVLADVVLRLLAACTSSRAQIYLSQVMHTDVDNRAGSIVLAAALAGFAVLALV